MACREQGMALVSVVVILTALLIIAHILFEKVVRSTQRTAEAANREQVLWAAYGGVEFARERLAATYVASTGWQQFLQNASGNHYPSSPTWTETLSGVNVDIYLRDNPDGDSNARRDNDLKIYVLARARGYAGVESVVESLCEFDASSQRGGQNFGANVSKEDLSLSGLAANTYESSE